MEHTVVGKDGYPTVVSTNGYGRNDDYLSELLTLKAIGDGTRDTVDSVNRTGIAGIKETSDRGSDNIRETARVGADLSSAISDARSAVERANGESRLSMAIASGEIRELINTTSTTNLIAIKENGYAVREEGCKTRETVLVDGSKTREKSAEQFAALQLQACKDAAALAAQIAECCCEQKQEAAATRALILAEGQKRTEDALRNAQQDILLLKLSNSKPGNS